MRVLLWILMKIMSIQTGLNAASEIMYSSVDDLRNMMQNEQFVGELVLEYIVAERKRLDVYFLKGFGTVSGGGGGNYS